MDVNCAILNFQGLTKPGHNYINMCIDEDDCCFGNYSDFEGSSKLQGAFNTQHTTSESGRIELPMKGSFDFNEEVEALSKQSNLKVKYLNENRILIDASKFSGILYGETTLVIIISKLSMKSFYYVINSAIPFNTETEDKHILEEFLSSSDSLLDAVIKICENVFSSRIISGISSDHQDWACCSENISVGVIQDWDIVCETVRETYTSYPATSSEKANEKELDMCSECKRHKTIRFELFEVVGGIQKCRNCLRLYFSKEFRDERFPIDLQLVDSTRRNLNTFDFLPAIIPLPVFNSYTKKMFELMFRYLGATGISENCSKCKSLLYFEDQIANSALACPCGFYWCSKCRVPLH